MTDDTFSDYAAYGTDRWCAATLGKSLPWFKKSRPTLEKEGFPRLDALIGLTLKADVEAWLARRRRVADADAVAPHHGTTSDMHTGAKVEHL